MNPLRQWRITQQLRAIDIALRLGVAERTVLAWEHGAFKPSGEAFHKLAGLLEVSQSELQTSWFNWLMEMKNAGNRAGLPVIPPSLGLRDRV